MTTIKIDGEFTIFNAAHWQEKLGQALPEKTVTLDLAGVVEMDTAGLQLLLFFRQMREKNRQNFHVSHYSIAVNSFMNLMHDRVEQLLADVVFQGENA